MSIPPEKLSCTFKVNVFIAATAKAFFCEKTLQILLYSILSIKVEERLFLLFEGLQFLTQFSSRACLRGSSETFSCRR